MDGYISNRLLMPYELAHVLNVSVSWVRNHAAPSSKNRIPTKKVGGLLRFDFQEVMAWLEKTGASRVDPQEIRDLDCLVAEGERSNPCHK